MQNNSCEEWRPIQIDGLPGVYAISETGRVFGFGTRWKAPGLINPVMNGWGYQQITFRRFGKSHSVPVHRLVAMQFCSGYSEGYEVDHVDGNKQNNCASNLEWVTPKENKQRAYRNGLYPTVGRRGRKSSVEGITETVVRWLREQNENGMSFYRLGKETGIDRRVIGAICQRRYFSNVV